MKTHLKRLTAHSGDRRWDVDVFSYRDAIEITGRSSSFIVHLLNTEQGYLVSVPYHNRCGYVPADVNARDVQEYVGIENPIDAATLAAGLKYLIEQMESGRELNPNQKKVIIEITRHGWKETLYSGRNHITKEKFKTSDGVMGLFWDDEDSDLYKALNGLKDGCLKVVSALGQEQFKC